MELQFKITFKRSLKTVAEIQGTPLPPSVANNLTVGELVEQVHETEEFLEKLTGLRVHIEQVL